MDPAGHINNSHYWAPLEEDLASGPEPGAIDAEVEYRDPAVSGEAVLLRDGSSSWIASTDGAIHASIVTASPSDRGHKRPPHITARGSTPPSE
jgi:acyl-ACP thioesterase